MKPATQITDRAKRYRANSETSDWPRVCMFCGSTKDLQVDHLDGYEENGEPENLLMLCRSCNQLKSAVYKKAGLGRRTVQFNPADAVARHKGFTILKRDRGYGTTAGYIFKSIPARFHAKTATARSFIDTFKNPAKSPTDWTRAVDALRGAPNAYYMPHQAARIIRSTPISRRYQYLDRVMRANPSVPTYEQYAFAVSTHERGAHDEGGAIIHATPSSSSQRVRAKDRGRESAAGDFAEKVGGSVLIKFNCICWSCGWGRSDQRGYWEMQFAPSCTWHEIELAVIAEHAKTSDYPQRLTHAFLDVHSGAEFVKMPGTAAKSALVFLDQFPPTILVRHVQ